MADGQDPLKKKLLGWVQGALNKVEGALEENAAPPKPAAPSGKLTLPGQSGPLGKPGSGPLGKPGSGPLAKPGSGPLGRPGSGPLGKPAPPRAVNTGSLQSGTDSLVRSEPPAASAASTQPLEPADSAEASTKRMAFIVAYMKDPASDPAFQDKALVYKILSEERAYQQSRILDLTGQLRRLPPPAEQMGLSAEDAEADPAYDGLEARRAELDEQLKAAQNRQTQLFMLLKRLTGVKGKTGGTGFIASSQLPPAPLEPKE